MAKGHKRHPEVVQRSAEGFRVAQSAKRGDCLPLPLLERLGLAVRTPDGKTLL